MTAVLLPYPQLPASLEPHDPRAPEVAALFIATIRAVAPTLTPEHIGSSSVPGLDGKGIIDLQLAAPGDEIPALTDALVAAGWQRQEGPHAFPPTRPMLRAAIEADGRIFRSHLHIVLSGSPELGETLAFRDALRADPALRAAYVARKGAIVESGITEGVAYARAKGGFVEETLKALRSR